MRHRSFGYKALLRCPSKASINLCFTCLTTTVLALSTAPFDQDALHAKKPAEMAF
jgi:hypothetical protein